MVTKLQFCHSIALLYPRINSLCSDFIPFVLKHYGQSLQFGNKFIYQSMPRLLTIWLDFGATVSDQGKGKFPRPYPLSLHHSQAYKVAPHKYSSLGPAL